MEFCKKEYTHTQKLLYSKEDIIEYKAFKNNKKENALRKTITYFHDKNDDNYKKYFSNIEDEIIKELISNAKKVKPDNDFVISLDSSDIGKIDIEEYYNKFGEEPIKNTVENIRTKFFKEKMATFFE